MTEEFSIDLRSITRVQASGLMDKYVREAIGSSRPESQDQGKARVLRLKDFGAHFIVLALGLTTSTLTFTIRYVGCRKPSEAKTSTTLATSSSPFHSAYDMRFRDVHTESRTRRRGLRELRFFRLVGRNQYSYQIH